MIKNEAHISLEFDKVLKLISGFSKSSAGRAAVLHIVPIESKVEILKRVGLVQEIGELSLAKTPLPLTHFEDISSPLDKVRPQNAIIDAQDFLDIKTVLTVISDIASVEFEIGDCPHLRELTIRLTGFPELLDRLRWTFDGEGKVVDDASVELYEIRKRLKSLNARIGNRLKEMVREENVAKFLQDDFITKRGERWVIPVRMDAKGEVAGVVHDVSSSGETAFMEPLEIIGLSNELGNLAADEKAEVIRILREICDEIRQDRDELLKQYEVLIHLDLLNSIATYADKLQMSPANINESSALKLRDAKHPLLISMEKSGTIKKVVPLNLALEGEDCVMVITGPNAGGKTITMKTVGLLILMAMSGIPIPAHPESTLPFTTNLLVDIGDEQSIESSLSTFSAHIARISKILEESSRGAVVLLDEIGTGTEPAQGAAIACAILNELSSRGATVLATTHLTDIIGFVYKTPGMMNASMEFDETSHEPLYKLKEGEPGQSHAIETAIRFGLPKEVTDFAGKLLGGMSAEFHELLKSLKEKGASYDALKVELEKERRELGKKEEVIREKLEEAESKKRLAYEEGLKEAHDFLINAKREARTILEETKGRPRVAIAKLEEKRQDIAEKLKQFEDRKPLEIANISVGDRLYIRTIGSDGSVKAIDKKKKRIEVESGGISFKVPLSNLDPARGTSKKKSSAASERFEAEEVLSSIKIIGLRAEEALAKVETYLDSAAMSGRDEVRIIHGVGTGALIKAVRNYLKTHPHVKDFRQGELSEGGDGVTVVKMK